MSRYFKIHTFISIITSLILSRAVFYFIDDPEGPNLLIVVVLAGVVYFLSRLIANYFLTQPTTALKRFLLTVLIQVLVTGGLYLILRI